MKNRSKKRKHFGGQFCFDFSRILDAKRCPGPSQKSPKIEKSKKLRSGQRSLLLEVLGKGFGMIFDGFGERSEGMLRHGVRLFKPKHGCRNPKPKKTHSKMEESACVVQVQSTQSHRLAR